MHYKPAASASFERPKSAACNCAGGTVGDSGPPVGLRQPSTAHLALTHPKGARTVLWKRWQRMQQSLIWKLHCQISHCSMGAQMCLMCWLHT